MNRLSNTGKNQILFFKIKINTTFWKITSFFDLLSTLVLGKEPISLRSLVRALFVSVGLSGPTSALLWITL